MPLPTAAESQGMTVAEQARANKVLRAQRRSRILGLAAGGGSVESIAAVMEMSPRGVQSTIRRALERYRASDLVAIENVRAQQLQRLDAMLVAVWGKVGEGNLNAIDRAIRIEALRAKIAGTEKLPEGDGQGSAGGQHLHLHGVDPAEVETLRESFAAFNGTATDLPPEAPALPAGP